jgi:gas vesicle protein
MKSPTVLIHRAILTAVSGFAPLRITDNSLCMIELFRWCATTYSMEGRGDVGQSKAYPSGKNGTVVVSRPKVISCAVAVSVWGMEARRENNQLRGVGTMGSSDKDESGNLSVFIAGALVGAGDTLLFAPQSGSQRRRLLRDYAARAKNELDDAGDCGADAWDSAEDRGQEFVEKGKESLREAGRQAKGFAEAGRNTVHDTTDALASQHR